MNKKSLLLLPLVLAILLIPAADIYAGDDGNKKDDNQKKVDDKSKDQSNGDPKNKDGTKGNESDEKDKQNGNDDSKDNDNAGDDVGKQDGKDDNSGSDNNKGNSSDDENRSNEQNTNDSNSDNNSESNEDAANNDDTNQNTSTNDGQNVPKKDDDEDEREQRPEDKNSKESNDDSMDENNHMEHDMGKSNDSQDTSKRHWYHDYSKRDKLYLDITERLMGKSSESLLKKYENEIDDVNPSNLINKNLNIKNDAPTGFLHKQAFETFLAHKVTIDFDNEKFKVGTSYDDLVYDLGLLADGYYHSATMFDNKMTLMKKHCVGMTLLLIDAIEEYEHLQFSAKRHHEAYENIMFIIEDITDHWIDKQ